MNIAVLLANSARCMGERPAIMVGARLYLDYTELGRQVACLAGAMRHRFGLAPGCRVLLAMTNNADYLTILFACWHAGLVAVPANAKLHPREIAFIAEDSDCALAFVSPEIFAGADAGLAAIPVVAPQSQEFASLVRYDPIAMHSADAGDIAWIFYTSGTTGRPKGAQLTHRNLASMAIGYLADIDSLGPTDSLLHLAATSHASGLFALSHVARASANILPESGGYDGAEMAAIIAANPSLSFFAPTTLINTMAGADAVLAAPLGNIRTILTGAGPVYAEDIRRALATFGPRLWNGYGQGESPCTISAMSKQLLWQAYESGDDDRLVSVGLPRTGIEIRISADGGRETEDEGIGEVLVRGETVMSGYLNQPEASAETLAGGWLHTGDLGWRDRRGFLYLSDRKKDLIISGGMNVYAREVEEVLLAHPAVAEVAVIGARDSKWGESVLALVVPADAAHPPAADVLDALCLEQLARFKRPKRYIAVDALPKNPAGKVLKAQLREAYRAAFE